MIPNDFRRGECRDEWQSRTQRPAACKTHESSPRRVLLAASIPNYVKRRCAPILILRIRTSGRQARRGGNARCLARKLQIPRPLRGFGTTKNERRLRVRQHAPDLLRVRRINLHRAAKMAHAFRLLRAEQMALERVRAHDLAGFRYSKAFRGATMRF